MTGPPCFAIECRTLLAVTAQNPTQRFVTAEFSAADDAARRGIDFSGDTLRPFRRLITIFHVALALVGAYFAKDQIRAGDPATLGVLILVVAATIFRAFHGYSYVWQTNHTGSVRIGVAPKAVRGTAASVATVLLDVVVASCAVIATGNWNSPFAVILMAPVAVAGLADGLALSLQVAGLTVLGVSTAMLAAPHQANMNWPLVLQWTLQLATVAVITGTNQRVFGRAQREHSEAFERLQRLQHANLLLADLHSVTQQLPVGLDLQSVLDAALPPTAAAFDAETVVMLIPKDSDRSTWRVAWTRHTRSDHEVELRALPPEARHALASAPSVVDDFAARSSKGLAADSRSALYARLGTVERPVGLLVLESPLPLHFDPRQSAVVAAMLGPIALAVDNAMWFARVRRVGADQERIRLARELHDRVGQSVAFLGFELDRLARSAQGTSLADEISKLRRDVRQVVSEIRGTLYELRSDVDETKDLTAVLTEFAGRISERSDLKVNVDSTSAKRLPLLVERELWRIAQEAILNAERHSQGNQVWVTWSMSTTEGELVVEDNGIGFRRRGRGRPDSYGLIGMRERADSIDAELTIGESPQGGTRVRCRVPFHVAG